MLLYISTTENIGIPDFLTTQGVVMKKLTGNVFKLNQIVKTELKSINHIQSVLVDLTAITDTKAELAEAVRAFHMIYDFRLIFLAEGKKRGNGTLSALVAQGVTNLVTATTVNGIQQELTLCLSQEGMPYSYVKSFDLTASDNVPAGAYSFPEESVTVAVAAAGPGAGATTQAIALANYVALRSASTCYCEAHVCGHLALTARLYEDFLAKPGFYARGGVDYYPCESDAPPGEYQFCIQDFGLLCAQNVSAFAAAEVRVLVSRTKPYELHHLAALETLVPPETALMLTDASPLRIEQLKALLAPLGTPLCSESLPDFCEPAANDSLFKALLSRYVIENHSENPPAKKPRAARAKKTIMRLF